MRLLFLLESRATIGYSVPLLRHAHSFRDTMFYVLPAGAHTSSEFGATFGEDHASIAGHLNTQLLSPIYRSSGSGSLGDWQSAFCEYQKAFVRPLDEVSPDLVVVFGDRMESLAMTLTAAFLRIPVAHIQAGDRSGHIDDQSRHAMARFVSLHLASNAESAERLRAMGEEPWRVHDVGAAQLDGFDLVERLDEDQLASELEIARAERFAIILYHPVHEASLSTQLQELEAIHSLVRANQDVTFLWIGPNNDAGYRQIVDSISTAENVVYRLSVQRAHFLRLLASSICLIGNSSAGILEAPALGIPSINLGGRQNGRLRPVGVIDVGRGGPFPTIQAAFDACEQIRSNIVPSANPYFKPNAGYLAMTTIQDFVAREMHLIPKSITY